MSATSTTVHHPNIKAYLVVFGALMVFTVVTVLVSYVHLPPAPAILVGLFIATVKASLVAAFFMHLKGERVMIYGLLGVTIFFMGILFMLPISDTVTSTTRIQAPAAVSKSPDAHAP